MIEKDITKEYSFQKLKDEIIPALSKEHKYGEKGNKLRKQRAIYIGSLRYNGYSNRKISLALGKSIGYISQLEANIPTKVKKSKSTSLKTQSIAAKGKIIGTTLGSILHDMDNDVIKQIEMIDTLKIVGYKEDDVIKQMQIPSQEEFKQIMDAVKKLSKNYEITRKVK